MTTLYRFVGPAHLLERGASLISEVRAPQDLEATIEQLGPGPLTFVITAAGQLRLGPRESEHVQIAGGSPVQTAGEISFTTTSGVTVESITNQSTGYCPEPGSISALHAIAKQLKVAIPDSFTTEVMFRRCPTCEATNIVKDDWFVCAECSAELPPTWNFS